MVMNPVVSVAGAIGVIVIVGLAFWHASGGPSITERRAELCKLLQTEGVERETKHVKELGCLVKRGDGWVIR